MAADNNRGEPIPDWRRQRPWLLGLAGFGGALLFWTGMALWLRGGRGVIDRLPTPFATFGALVDYARGSLWRDLAASLEVFLAGWLLGCLAATLLGMLIGRSRLFGAVIGPVVETMRPISSIVWVPLAIVWFGFGFTSKIFLVGLSVFFVVIVYATDGARRISRDLERTALMLGMSPWQRFCSLLLPAALTEVLTGARVALMSGWGTVIVAELVAADFGLGARLIAVQQSYAVAAVMASMICFGLTGFLMNMVFTRIERRLLPWRVSEALR